MDIINHESVNMSIWVCRNGFLYWVCRNGFLWVCRNGFLYIDYVYCRDMNMTCTLCAHFQNCNENQAHTCVHQLMIAAMNMMMKNLMLRPTIGLARPRRLEDTFQLLTMPLLLVDVADQHLSERWERYGCLTAQIWAISWPAMRHKLPGRSCYRYAFHDIDSFS